MGVTHSEWGDALRQLVDPGLDFGRSELIEAPLAD